VQPIMGETNIQFTNREGIEYSIPLSFLAKETCIGDRVVSYQIIRMKKSELFSIEELYVVAGFIQEHNPRSLINWVSTFELLEKEKPSRLRKKLEALHLL
jgi:hypothetical protein